MPQLLAEEKKRVTPKRPRDYVAWAVAVAIVTGLVWTAVTNENYRWPVVFSYFTTETILRGLMLTLFLTVASMALGTLLGLAARDHAHVAPDSRSPGWPGSTSPSSVAPRCWCS